MQTKNGFLRLLIKRSNAPYNSDTRTFKKWNHLFEKWIFKHVPLLHDIIGKHYDHFQTSSRFIEKYFTKVVNEILEGFPMLENTTELKQHKKIYERISTQSVCGKWNNSLAEHNFIDLYMIIIPIQNLICRMENSLT